MESELERLSLKAPPKKGAKEEVAEAWDEASLSSSDSDAEPAEQGKDLSQKATRSKKSSVPSAPPPTPIIPRTGTPDWGFDGACDSDNVSRFTGRHEEGERRRPEKSMAVAGRLIAGALGVKAPRKTEEQRQYERSVKEQEIRRRNREREQKEKERLDDEKAKASVWDG